MRTRRGAWATLVVGLAVIALAAWLVRREPPMADPVPPVVRDGPAASGLPGASPGGDTAPRGTNSPPADAVDYVVRWGIDGDTVDLDRGGTVTRLRLLNIDAPERAHNGVPVECLAEAAFSRLVELAPRGTHVLVAAVGQDKYGRTLGEAWLPDGRMLGAEIARSGLAAPLTVGHEARYRPVIDAARDEAAAAAAGLHDPKVKCSVPARVVTVEGQLHGIPNDDPRVATVTSEALAVLADLTSATPKAGVAALTDATRTDLIDRVRSVLAAVGQLR